MQVVELVSIGITSFQKLEGRRNALPPTMEIMARIRLVSSRRRCALYFFCITRMRSNLVVLVLRLERLLSGIRSS